MSETLPKYGSVDLRRKVNSHTKLPRLPSVEIGNKLSESIVTLIEIILLRNSQRIRFRFWANKGQNPMTRVRTC